MVVFTIFVPKSNYMEQLKSIDVNKASILELGMEGSFNKPQKCNNLVLVLCKSGEVEVEINYVTYTIAGDNVYSNHR